MAYPNIYSQRFANEADFAGTFTELNDTGNTWIVRTITAVYGGLSIDASFAIGIDGGPQWYVWNFTDAEDGTGSLLIQQAHLVINPGESLLVVTVEGWDFSVHGYSLSPP